MILTAEETQRLADKASNYKARLRWAGICMSCIDGPPDPSHGCTDCLNTGWDGGDPQDQIARLEEALLVAGAHCQGGHSEAGRRIADLFGIPFPLRMENLREAAVARKLDPADLWPWCYLKQRTNDHTTDSDVSRSGL